MGDARDELARAGVAAGEASFCASFGRQIPSMERQLETKARANFLIKALLKSARRLSYSKSPLLRVGAPDASLKTE